MSNSLFMNSYDTKYAFQFTTGESSNKIKAHHTSYITDKESKTQSYF